MRTDDLAGLEQKLHFSLHPVDPDPRFVRVLEHRLTDVPSITLEKRPRLRAVGVIGMGLFSGVLLYWLLRRLWLWIGKA